jgi:glutaredoxin
MNKLHTPSLRTLAAGLALLGLQGLALAQFKVVGPDGKVTYTDRPPADGKLTRVQSNTGASVDPSLPFALRGVAERFPVTLYTSGDCGDACKSARELLQQRGIPYRERTISTDEDRQAWQQLNLGAMVPVVRIGGQVHAGFNDGEWSNTLTLAGYPLKSALPSNYKAAATAPLGDRKPAPVAAAAPEAVRTEVPVDRSANPNGIRF